jgi:fibronectin-binding autotransporter adhesin
LLQSSPSLVAPRTLPTYSSPDGVARGTNAATWTLGGTSPTVNLNGLNGTQGLNYTVAFNLTLAANTTFTGNGTASFNFSSPIGESGGARVLTKSGDSTLTLSVANTYTGATNVILRILRSDTSWP